MIGYKKRFLHISYVFPLLTPDQQGKIEILLNLAGDWLRYAPNCWIVYSEQHPAR